MLCNIFVTFFKSSALTLERAVQYEVPLHFVLFLKPL